MEENMKLLLHSQSTAQTGTVRSDQAKADSLPHHRDSSAADGSVPTGTSPQIMYSANMEMGDIDTSEDAIDGMGAIKFTDEEDCGYFGRVLPACLQLPVDVRFVAH
jgi:hypothetical protein